LALALNKETRMSEPNVHILPFHVHRVHNEAQLHQAAALRLEAYSRHLEGLSPEVGLPDALDRDPACCVFVARHKSDGRTLGTLRIHANIDGPLGIEKACPLPDCMTQALTVEPTRLAVEASALGTQAKTALFKALYLYCTEQGIDYIVAGARTPIDRMYEALHFKDVHEVRKTYPYALGLPHRVMYTYVPSMRGQFEPTSAMHRYVVGTHHPDIDTAAPALRSALPQCA
jgi:hypothetical protein